MLKQFGVSLSHRQCRHFKVDWYECVDLAKQLRLDTIRMPVYWSECQPHMDDEPDFALVRKQLNYLRQSGLKVCLQIGVKALWWPEYYFPKGTNYQQFFQSEIEQKRYFVYLDKLLKLAARYKNIISLQVENEPLNPSGPKRQVLPEHFLQEELTFVKQRTNKPLLTSTWLPGLHTRRVYKLLKLSKLKIIGLHFYYDYEETILNWTAYISFWLLKLNLATIFKNQRQNFIMTELQAMPWRGDIVRRAVIDTVWYENWLRRLIQLPISGFWLWGIEFWLLRRKEYNDNSWVDMIAKLTR